MSDEEVPGGPSQAEIKGENDPNAPINVKVVTSSGEEVFFKIKRSTKLSKLQGAYASKVGKDVATIRFLYDGNRIQEDDTPESLEMEDNDTIDVMVERTFVAFPFLFLMLMLGVVTTRGWRLCAAVTNPLLVAIFCFANQYDIQSCTTYRQLHSPFLVSSPYMWFF
ncbi:ubiquitin-like protein [Guyanagaster necrorhizus]|uniref:Ubiquitin-like protein n=1 Tax=Guyanagaster necrorhizus TaxID=856835 RepID=A0A9P7VJ91_9AGAR|nr:ubiquitin-like protein [Guyanagaster necrorhizus MCA 3950]KAG7441699.1 ubiquitin-like protein [Guyanagaster necrorhizus MCA 3950]